MPPANTCFLLSQQIDELLAGALTQEDEDAVLAELEAITQVGVELHVWLLLVQRTVAERACSSPVTPYFTFILQLSESSRDFTLKKIACLSVEERNNPQQVRSILTEGTISSFLSNNRLYN